MKKYDKETIFYKDDILLISKDDLNYMLYIWKEGRTKNGKTSKSDYQFVGYHSTMPSLMRSAVHALLGSQPTTAKSLQEVLSQFERGLDRVSEMGKELAQRMGANEL